MHRGERIWCWWLLLAVALVWPGCFGRPSHWPGRSVPLPDASQSRPGTEGVLDQLDGWAAIGIAAGVLCLFGAVVGMIWAPGRLKGRAWQLGVTGAALIVGSYVLAWVSAHQWAIVLAIVVCAAVLGWTGRYVIERWLGRDLTGDGHIGDPRDLP